MLLEFGFGWVFDYGLLVERGVGSLVVLVEKVGAEELAVVDSDVFLAVGGILGLLNEVIDHVNCVFGVDLMLV